MSTLSAPGCCDGSQTQCPACFSFYPRDSYVLVYTTQRACCLSSVSPAKTLVFTSKPFCFCRSCAGSDDGKRAVSCSRGAVPPFQHRAASDGAVRGHRRLHQPVRTLAFTRARTNSCFRCHEGFEVWCGCSSSFPSPPTLHRGVLWMCPWWACKLRDTGVRVGMSCCM